MVYSNNAQFGNRDENGEKAQTPSSELPVGYGYYSYGVRSTFLEGRRTQPWRVWSTLTENNAHAVEDDLLKLGVR